MAFTKLLNREMAIQRSSELLPIVTSHRRCDELEVGRVCFLFTIAPGDDRVLILAIAATIGGVPGHHRLAAMGCRREDSAMGIQLEEGLGEGRLGDGLGDGRLGSGRLDDMLGDGRLGELLGDGMLSAGRLGDGLAVA